MHILSDESTSQYRCKKFFADALIKKKADDKGGHDTDICCSLVNTQGITEIKKTVLKNLLTLSGTMSLPVDLAKKKTKNN